MIPRKLITTIHKEMIKSHLKTLEGRDRYLRFAAMVSDEYIDKYVEDSWLGDNEWFGIVQYDKVIAVVHVAVDGNKAELGLSVDPEWRGNKLGQAIFERAVISLRAHGINDVFMHCLSENSIIKHIATKNKMVMKTEYGETDADLKLSPSTPLDSITDVVVEHLAIYDSTVRNANAIWKKIYDHT